MCELACVRLTGHIVQSVSLHKLHRYFVHDRTLLNNIAEYSCQRTIMSDSTHKQSSERHTRPDKFKQCACLLLCLLDDSDMIAGLSVDEMTPNKLEYFIYQYDRQGQKQHKEPFIEGQRDNAKYVCQPWHIQNQEVQPKGHCTGQQQIWVLVWWHLQQRVVLQAAHAILQMVLRPPQTTRCTRLLVCTHCP